MLLGDCCLDYQPVCLTNATYNLTKDTPERCHLTVHYLQRSNLTADYLQRRQVQGAAWTVRYITIVRTVYQPGYKLGESIVTFYPLSPNLRIVGKCPHTYTGNREMCENSTYTQWTVHVVLATFSQSSKLVFKNE